MIILLELKQGIKIGPAVVGQIDQINSQKSVLQGGRLHHKQT